MSLRKVSSVLQLTLVVLSLGCTFSKRCPFSKEIMFPHSIKVSLNISSHGEEYPAGNDIKTHSLSPWNYSINKDENRYPAVIHEARCHHEGCLDMKGKEDISMYSVPVKQEILVLRREMKGCTPTFRLEKQIVAVGCTCVRPIIHHGI